MQAQPKWATTAFRRSLRNESDFLRVHMRVDRDQVLRFTVQYEALVGEETYPVVRYDSAHGAAHRDTLDRADRVVAKDWLVDKTFADIDANWPTYRDVSPEEAMSAQTMPTSDLDAPEQVHKRLDLTRRFMLAGFEDTTIFDDLPFDVLLVLLPDDDPAFVENEIAAGAASARSGHDLYFRHIRSADLPE